MSDRLLTTREAAQRLGRSRDFVMALIRRRRLSYVRLGARYYVHEWSLNELTAPQRQEPAAADFPKRVFVRGKRVA